VVTATERTAARYAVVDRLERVDTHWAERRNRMMMMLLDMLAATPAATAPDRSWVAWGYDVSKNIASAAFVALLVAVIGKAVGVGVLARIRWSALLGIVGFMVTSGVYGTWAGGFWSLRDLVSVLFFPALAGLSVGLLVYFGVWRRRDGWFIEQPPQAESYWDAYWAVRPGNPPR
jgi:hypothetical protein